MDETSLIETETTENSQMLSDVDSFTPVSIGFKTNFSKLEDNPLSSEDEESLQKHREEITPPDDLKIKASENFMSSMKKIRYVIVKPKDVKVFASSKFLDRIKYPEESGFNKTELAQEYTEKAFTIMNSFQTDQVDRNKLKEVNDLLKHALEYDPDNPKIFFGMAKLMTLLGEYRKAFDYINRAMEFGYVQEELEDLRLYVMEKFSKFQNLSSYAFEHKIQQRLYSILQNERTEPPKISNDVEYLKALKQKYEELEKSYVELIAKAKKNETLMRPFEVLRKRYSELLEKSVLLNIISDNIEENLGFLEIFKQYLEEDFDFLSLKGKVNLLLNYQCNFYSFFMEELSNNSFKVETDLPDLLDEFKQKLSTLDFAEEYILFPEHNMNYLAFEVERSPKVLNMYGLKINLKDNTKLTGIILKAFRLYPQLKNLTNREVALKNLNSYLEELEPLLDFISQREGFSVTNVLQASLVISLYLALAITYMDIKKEKELFSGEILENALKKLKLCFL